MRGRSEVYEYIISTKAVTIREVLRALIDRYSYDVVLAMLELLHPEEKGE